MKVDYNKRLEDFTRMITIRGTVIKEEGKFCFFDDKKVNGASLNIEWTPTGGLMITSKLAIAGLEERSLLSCVRLVLIGEDGRTTRIPYNRNGLLKTYTQQPCNFLPKWEYVSRRSRVRRPA